MKRPRSDEHRSVIHGSRDETRAVFRNGEKDYRVSNSVWNEVTAGGRKIDHSRGFTRWFVTPYISIYIYIYIYCNHNFESVFFFIPWISQIFQRSVSHSGPAIATIIYFFQTAEYTRIISIEELLWQVEVRVAPVRSAFFSFLPSPPSSTTLWPILDRTKGPVHASWPKHIESYFVQHCMYSL